MVNSKSCVVFIACVICFSGITICRAQSLIGKWKGVSVKNYFSAAYAKEIGRSMEEKTSKEVGNSEIDYIADHTFILTFSPPNSSDVTTMKGTWSATGDQLKITMEPQYNPRKTSVLGTFTVTGNTMVTTVVIAPPSRIVKTVSTGIRL
jgi:hypothetical protein